MPPASPDFFLASLVAASPRRAVGDGTLGPALKHENYETNPKQFLRILFKCNWFPQFGRFFCPQNEPKSPRTTEDRPSSAFLIISSA
jgi:hypothetical protein